MYHMQLQVFQKLIVDCTYVAPVPFLQYNLQGFNGTLLYIQDDCSSTEGLFLLFLDKSTFHHEAAKLYQNI